MSERAKTVFRTLLALLAAVAGLAAAQPNGSPAWPDRQVTGQYWLDTTGKASLEAARAAFDARQGKPVDPDQVMPLGGGVALWYQLQFPSVTRPVAAVFTISFSGTDSVELLRADGAGWQSQRAGDSVPVSQWPLPYLRPAFAFTLEPGDTEAAYLRVQHTHPIRVEWRLWDGNGFTASARAWHLGLGVYVGFMLLVLMLSVVNTVSWRDPIHLLYAGHVVLVGLSILSLTGLAGEYLWPDNAWWNDKATVALPAASLCWVALFVRELVSERGGRLVSWSLIALSALGLAMTVGVLLVSRETFFRAPSLYLVPGMVLILGILAWYSRRRPEVGLWVLAGFAVLITGSVWQLARNLGLIGPSFLTDNGPQLGAALEIPLVLIGLYFRGRERRDSRVRLEALSHTDPLTGLGNHRVLMLRLTHLLKRARRDPAIGAVLRVRVANLHTINEEYGREAMEAAMVRAAECVARGAIEGDTVARDKGGDVVLLMEGAVARHQIAETGRNIIARGLKFSRRLPRGVALHIKVAAACAPLSAVDAATLMELLDQELQQIAADPHGKAMHILVNTESLDVFEDAPVPEPRRA
ncbi:MAG TPA: 7TM diverse intracellular signaling domain-containing protein [Ramlibacter sp.]|nr:7TM diverse intracellular signaling domain-containing protein [Ramlibacter sp.]